MLPFHVDGALFVTDLCPQSAYVVCNGVYAVTQQDMDDGLVLNTGTVSCVDPEANPIVEKDNNTVHLLGMAIVSLGKLPAIWTGNGLTV